ncbi:MAG: mechanosensitive ion channel family protein, partial [Pelagibacteraceae bacterium TMED124]
MDKNFIQSFLDFRWLTFISSSQHIQVKIVATLIALILFPLIKKTITSLFINKIKNSEKRYKWNKTVSYMLYFLIFFIIGSIWFEGFESIATYLGLVSAGIAIALKDPITNITGWLYIIARSPFKIGDRIELGNNAGDVVDITISNFTIMEIGNWVDTNQYTGRLIHIPNGRV